MLYMNRRSVLVSSLAALSSLAVRRTAFAADAGALTFTSWGGSTQDAQKAAWAQPFTTSSGFTVKQDGPTDYGKFKSMVDAGAVSWDVVDVEADFAHRAAAQGLLEKLDFSVIDRSRLDPRFVFDYGVGSFFFAFVLAYNTQALHGAAPAGWDALFDLKKYPGKRALYKWPSAGVVEIALLADGVTPDKLYPLDLDRAFRKLDTIKASILWWGSGAQSQQLIASGEASLGMFWNGRIHYLEQEKAPVAPVWKQNLTFSDMLVVPKGTRNREAAMRFIAEATSAKAQAAFDNATAYAPIHLDAVPLLDKSIAASSPTSHTDSQIGLDAQYWATNGAAIAERWNAWQVA
ncbi:ABC transporter substrate-binding protein [Aliidongia dinghuensis]|uniref:ABC transporter substrate-binding protein n=1 Tax=Aliidongia dinghuensis TaxID=1867774 RepID=A0A8J3E5B5_9PROT|nr:ABC transporter substrate-binding protein [Aliidongia dinghuensis]GGF34454.1 ABC transporter substrate-binding protein [Aliidongia dinghuensis]